MPGCMRQQLVEQLVGCWELTALLVSASPDPACGSDRSTAFCGAGPLGLGPALVGRCEWDGRQRRQREEQWRCFRRVNGGGERRGGGGSGEAVNADRYGGDSFNDGARRSSKRSRLGDVGAFCRGE